MKKLKVAGPDLNEEKIFKMIIEEKEEDKKKLEEEKSQQNKEKKRDYFKDLYSDERDFMSDENRFKLKAERQKKDPFFRKDIMEIKDKLKLDKVKAIQMYHNTTEERKTIKKGVK